MQKVIKDFLHCGCSYTSYTHLTKSIPLLLHKLSHNIPFTLYISYTHFSYTHTYTSLYTHNTLFSTHTLTLPILLHSKYTHFTHIPLFTHTRLPHHINLTYSLHLTHIISNPTHSLTTPTTLFSKYTHYSQPSHSLHTLGSPSHPSLTYSLTHSYTI